MGKGSGRFEILSDQMALARHVAEWMTLAALAAKGPFRVSLSGGSTPKTLYQLLASDEFSGRLFSGTGEMSASFPTTIPTATIAWSARRCLRRHRCHRRIFTQSQPMGARRTRPAATKDPARGIRRDDTRSGLSALRPDPAWPWCRRPYGFAAARRTRSGGASAMGGGRLARAPRGPHHHDLSGD